ncbi:glutathione S-transferase [Aestuariivita sp.]|jgi:glutathione S-transferase|uniref:glutathione S-transferase family protein n=1 Tax=Aestuariivita sp. TaxID=1872407 RepID=UPI00216DF742|nr:glutathione S-transferase [Aestuariivita sp.]MCE8007544.1 glutathione S-transferase [Aestuariivita sp.]
MIFYDCATAPSPRRARMFIAEKGITVETRQIDLRTGEHLGAEFLALNPRGTVPVLVTDDGNVLTENLGIAAYLEARHPEPPLIGRTPDETGLIWMWTAICEHQGGLPVAEALRNSSPAMKDRALPGPVPYAQIPELAERGRARLGVFFDLLEERLSESRFLAGDSFSLADLTGYVFVDFARIVKLRIPEGHTASQDWFDRIAARPSAQA